MYSSWMTVPAITMDLSSNTFVKILKDDRTHRGVKYVLGRNECPQSFNDAECAYGGLYACRLKDLFRWFYLFDKVDTVAVVEIPDDAERKEFATKVKASALVITHFLPIIDAMEIAVYNGASVSVDKDSAIRWASCHGNLPVVQFLVHHGACHIHNALLIAVANRHYEVARFLLESGADPNVDDRDLNTAIDHATVHGDLPMVELLIKHGANTFDTAMSIAVRHGDLPIVKVLAEHGTINKEDAIKSAYREGNDEIFQFLKSLP